MPELAKIPPYPSHLPVLDWATVLAAVSSPQRWVLLSAMHDGGEGWAAKDAAGLLGLGIAAATKHLQILVRAGICVRGRGRCYRLAPHFQPPPGATPRVLDFGHFIIRFGLKPPGT
jgi:hypothetical protein